MENLDLIIRNGTVLISDPNDPSSIHQEKVDIGVKNSKIVKIEKNLKAEAARVFDANSFHVLPGIIDSQVHFRDPGFPDKEDFASGTKGAIQGGVTAIFDMHNTKPNTSTKERFLE